MAICHGAAAYLRVKAVEALGRMQAPESANALKRILEARKIFGWVHPQELRIAALQALEKLEPAWVAEYLPTSGIGQEDLRLAPLDSPAIQNSCGTGGIRGCGCRNPCRQ